MGEERWRERERKNVRKKVRKKSINLSRCAFLLSGSALGGAVVRPLGGLVVLCYYYSTSVRGGKQRSFECAWTSTCRTKPGRGAYVFLGTVPESWTVFFPVMLDLRSSSLPLRPEPCSIRPWWLCFCLFVLNTTDRLMQRREASVAHQAALRWSPGPGTGHAGDWHDAAALLHHHVDVGPHDLSNLADLSIKKTPAQGIETRKVNIYSFEM